MLSKEWLPEYFISRDVTQNEVSGPPAGACEIVCEVRGGSPFQSLTRPLRGMALQNVRQAKKAALRVFLRRLAIAVSPPPCRCSPPCLLAPQTCDRILPPSNPPTQPRPALAGAHPQVRPRHRAALLHGPGPQRRGRRPDPAVCARAQDRVPPGVGAGEGRHALHSQPTGGRALLCVCLGGGVVDASPN